MKSILFILLIVVIPVLAENGERETRAVWVTTNFRLDWPPNSLDPEIQKKELVKIFDNIKNKNLNTVFFQVRSNGTAFYNSQIEPYSPYLTGLPDVPPVYDPLKFAVQLAHERGLEIHAWINMVRCYTGKEPLVLRSPKHLMNKHSDWIVEYNIEDEKSYWLNPALPEVQKYLVDIVSEIIEKYDVSGIHLDFIRYPGKDFEDEDTYYELASDLTIDDWRRDNISKIVKVISEKIKLTKPFLKYGVTPFGIYKNIEGAVGTEGFNDVFQSTRDWLKEKIIDYAVPQIYWDIETNPKFDKLAQDWIENSFGRNMVLGIASYKPEVFREQEQLIKLSRKLDASGVAFFRYKFIKNLQFTSFKNKSLPKQMDWKLGFHSGPPRNLRIFSKSDKNQIVKLSWDTPFNSNEIDTIQYFALFEKNHEDSSQNILIDVIDGKKTKMEVDLNKLQQINNYVLLKSLDKLWNESKASSNEVKLTNNSLKQISDNLSLKTPTLIKQYDNNYSLLIPSENHNAITVKLINGNLIKTLDKIKLEPGINFKNISINLSDYSLIEIVYESGKIAKLAL